MSRSVPCPQCRKPVEFGPQSAFRPFCSKRCQLIDLGRWAEEDFRIPVSREDSSAELSAETFLDEMEFNGNREVLKEQKI